MDKFEQMRQIRGKAYKPRTKHLSSDGWAKYTNRLFLESSPYLLQHAHNPVNWFPWGDEAFQEANRLNRPVLVSIGYSTCHWCHVMEEESFEDEEIATCLNEHFIAIKIDREERPDIDAIYMSAVQALTGRGGWPLNVFLTPDRKPFYGGTYFPARDGDRGSGMGLLTLLKKIRDAYHSRNIEVLQSSRQLTEIIREQLSPLSGDGLPSADVFRQAADFYKDNFDPTHGGIRGAPKFPSSLPVRFLFRHYGRTNDKRFLDMADHTLRKMAAGGMYDQVGGGFHRYSTDEKWLVPHFEKMLYDNALLVMAYLEGYQATGNNDFKRIVREILSYVEREMTSPEGAFYSATDADSLAPNGHMEEGYFFTWTSDEIGDALGKDRARIAREYYSVGLIPDFEGRHILNVPETAASVSRTLKITEQELAKVLGDSKTLLYKARSRRPPPLRDEKILTAWNSLMISAFARAGLVLGDSRYTELAGKAARFILKNMYIRKRLYRSYSEGKFRHKAFLDDYAFLIAALLDLFEASHEISWLKKAIGLDSILENYYEDREQGGFFMTGNDHEELIAREKPIHDGAVPSGNSIAVLNLLRLGEFTTDASYHSRSEKALRSFLGGSTPNPFALSEMLLALDFFMDRPREIIIVTPEGEEEKAGPFLKELIRHFIPNRILIVTSEGKSIEELSGIVPLVKDRIAMGGKTTVYVCEKGTCKLPVNDPGEFASQISQSKLP
ncbi:MAG: thioredoxin domain-containing protein [Deltaproteobacteria bacterium]|nr:thioredoxin domain-containing protein [Deltaproteobacteria bacterium]